MKRKISAIIISIILSIVGIVPTMGVTYAVSNNDVKESCLYETSWSWQGLFIQLYASNTGHIHIDVTRLKLPETIDYEKISYKRIGEIRFDDTYVAPFKHPGYAGVSTFTSIHPGSAYIECVQVGVPGAYYINYSNVDELYIYATILNSPIMTFDLYTTSRYLEYGVEIGLQVKVELLGKRIFIPYPTLLEEFRSKHATEVLGDVNNDGTVDGSDATIVLREFGQVLAGKPAQFTDAQFAAGDVDKNGVIDGSDATLILKFFGEAGKDKEISYGGMELWLQSWRYRNESTN